MVQYAWGSCYAAVAVVKNEGGYNMHRRLFALAPRVVCSLTREACQTGSKKKGENGGTLVDGSVFKIKMVFNFTSWSWNT